MLQPHRSNALVIIVVVFLSQLVQPFHLVVVLVSRNALDSFKVIEVAQIIGVVGERLTVFEGGFLSSGIAHACEGMAKLLCEAASEKGPTCLHYLA